MSLSPLPRFFACGKTSCHGAPLVDGISSGSAPIMTSILLFTEEKESGSSSSGKADDPSLVCPLAAHWGWCIGRRLKLQRPPHVTWILMAADWHRQMEAGGDARKCHNCGNTGHLRRDCPEAPAQAAAEGAFGYNQGASCFGCGKFGHLKRDCPSGGRACHNCGNVGHIRRDCPEEVLPPKCHNCGNTGHLRRDCPDEVRESRKCHHCGNSGHLRRDCPEDSGPTADKCYQCGESGHWARNCTGVKA